MTDEAPATNVVEALRRIMRDLPGISKARDPNGGVNYAFRGIEAITKEAQGLCAQHGVIFVPRVVGMPEVIDITVNGKPWTDTRMLVEYDVMCAAAEPGSDDLITIGPIFAIGRDNSDKGANKCMTQAFKYALLQTFMIADAKDDGDAQSVQAEWAEPATVPDDEGLATFRTATLKTEITSADVTRMRLKELAQRLKALGLKDSGTVTELRNRLTEYLLSSIPDVKKGAGEALPPFHPADIGRESFGVPEAPDGALLPHPDDTPQCPNCEKVIDISGDPVPAGEEGIEDEAGILHHRDCLHAHG